jgi:hypothetical protein
MNSMGLIELAHRESDGVEIALWWNRRTGELKVTVRDHMAGDAFDVVAGADEALDVFNHPYAYASARNVLYWDLCPADAA